MSETSISPRIDGPDDLDLVEDTATAATALRDPHARSRAVAAAREPRPAPSATRYAALLLVLLLAAAVTGIHDLLSDRGLVPGGSWTGAVLRALDGVERAPWLLWAGGALALLGLWVVVAAVRPRKHTHRQAADDPTLWVRPVDLARAASAAALGAADVATAVSTVRKQKVRTKLLVHPNADIDVVKDNVTTVVSETLDPMVGTVSVKVSAKRAGGSQ